MHMSIGFVALLAVLTWALIVILYQLLRKG